MHQRKSRKILIYILLLLSVGSINNISLQSIEFNKIKNINVTGLKKNENELILKKIQNLNLDNIFFINRNKLKKEIDENTLIDNY